MKWLRLFLFILLANTLWAQSEFQYRISFTDKDNSPYSINQPVEFLSSRSIDRRLKQGIAIQESDLPISPGYLRSLAFIPALEILSKSKWFNDIVIQTQDTSILQKIRAMDFVKVVEKMPGDPDKFNVGENKELESYAESSFVVDGRNFYGLSFRQTNMIQADYLHKMGFKGNGVRIAVIDAGFSGVNTSQHFQHLNQTARLIDTYDFVDKKVDVTAHSNHGTAVLSTMAAYEPGKFVGTAFESEYILLRSEDGADEYIVEEDYWVEAAEFADSAGADVINTSLGYSTFSDSLQDHSYEDLDGKSTRISIAAGMAYAKGMLLFNSAGNEGNSAWQKIIAPADNEDVITVGGVDSLTNLASFSSRGPTADGRLKPDVVAQAQLVYVGSPGGNIWQSNGTSFSSPIMAGAAACLWQAHFDKDRAEIKNAIYLSSDRVLNPDTNFGKGIPNLVLANEILSGSSIEDIQGETVLRVFPNPFTNHLVLSFNKSIDQNAEISIVDISGRTISNFYEVIKGGQASYIFIDQNKLPLSSGLYILKMSSGGLEEEFRIVKK